MDFTGLSQPLAGAQGRQAWGGGARMFCFASRFLTATQHFPAQSRQGASHPCVKRAGQPNMEFRQSRSDLAPRGRDPCMHSILEVTPPQTYSQCGMHCMFPHVRTCEGVSAGGRPRPSTGWKSQVLLGAFLPRRAVHANQARTTVAGGRAFLRGEQPD